MKKKYVEYKKSQRVKIRYVQLHEYGSSLQEIINLPTDYYIWIGTPPISRMSLWQRIFD